MATLRKAGQEVSIEGTPDGNPSQFFVVSFCGGKRLRESHPSLRAAQTRAEELLSELIARAFPTKLTRGGVAAQIYYTPTRTGYDAFTLTYYQDGQRRREQFGDVEDARKRGLQVLEGLSRGQPQAVTMTLGDRDAYVAALRHLKGVGVSLESACKEYAEASRLLGGVSVLQAARDFSRRHHGSSLRPTVRQVVDEFLAAKREGRSTRLRGAGRKVSARYLYELERKLNLFADRFRLPIGMVTAEEINRFIAGLEVEGRTKNNQIQAINVLFEFAKKQKYLPRDHDVLDEVELAAEADSAIDIFSPDELSKLITHAAPALVPALSVYETARFGLAWNR